MSGGVWIVELEKGVWLADGRGDPPRTLVRDNARRFRSEIGAYQALQEAARDRDLWRAKVVRRREERPAWLVSLGIDRSCGRTRWLAIGQPVLGWTFDRAKAVRFRTYSDALKAIKRAEMRGHRRCKAVLDDKQRRSGQ